MLSEIIWCRTCITHCMGTAICNFCSKFKLPRDRLDLFFTETISGVRTLSCKGVCDKRTAVFLLSRWGSSHDGRAWRHWISKRRTKLSFVEELVHWIQASSLLRSCWNSRGKSICLQQKPHGRSVITDFKLDSEGVHRKSMVSANSILQHPASKHKRFGNTFQK